MRSHAVGFSADRKRAWSCTNQSASIRSAFSTPVGLHQPPRTNMEPHMQAASQTASGRPLCNLSLPSEIFCMNPVFGTSPLVKYSKASRSPPSGTFSCFLSSFYPDPTLAIGCCQKSIFAKSLLSTRRIIQASFVLSFSTFKDSKHCPEPFKRNGSSN